jgi:pyridoxal phosphate enzyme (YggS family)
MGAAMVAPAAADNYRRIRDELPDEVQIVVASKTRSAAEVACVIEAGATVIGHNYVQEAEAMLAELGDGAARAEWHMIGHLQRNKINRALPTFDVIQSLDSSRLARALDRRADGPVRVLVEVNVAGEGSKSGVPFEEATGLVELAGALENLRVEGLMTMEPYLPDPEQARPYFVRMRQLFEDLKARALPGVDMRTLSMGMTHSYEAAVQEGANMVRIGTAIFGPRGRRSV